MLLTFVYILYFRGNLFNSIVFIYVRLDLLQVVKVMMNSVSGYNYNPYPAAYRAASGAVVLNKNEIQNLIKFTNGEPIATVQEPGVVETAVGVLPFAGIMGGFQGIGALKNNGLSGQELENFKAARKAGTAKGWNFSETIKNVKKQYPYTRGQAVNAGRDFLNREYGDFFKSRTTPNEARLPFGMGKLMDKIPGYARLRETGFGKAMGRSGAGFMAVMDGTIKTFTDVVPAFQQLGFKSGMKQIAKTGTEVGVGAVGWLAGDALGMSVGAAIGTAICPGVGTAIGGFLGRFIGGAIGGAVAAKTAKAITGKSEIELAKESAIKETTVQVENDPATKLVLAQEALKQAESILAEDPKNEEALIAKATAEKIILDAQAAQQVQTAQTTQNVEQQINKNNSNISTGVFNGVPVVPGFNGYNYDMNQYKQAAGSASLLNANSANPFIK